MATLFDNSLLLTWSAALAAAGITGVDVMVDSTESARDAASGEASFRWGGLILRLVRDQAQDYVDIGPATVPSQTYSLDDVGVGSRLAAR